MKTTAITLLLLALWQCSFAQHWQELGEGVQNPQAPTCLFGDSLHDRLYIAGQFSEAGGNPARGIASWDGSNWSPMGDGLDSFPMGPSIPANTRVMAHYGTHLYVGGNFKWAGDDNAKYLARWNGADWEMIPGGQPNGAVYDIQTFNNELYICGFFDSIGNLPASGIAKWDGVAWSQVGNYDFASSGSVTEMEFYHGNLYIGGGFADPQSLTCRLAKWDGVSWQFLTSALTGGIADVWDMIVYDDELYVSGLFYEGVGSNPGNSIMRWNDTTWRDVGGSCDFYSHNVPQVRQMEVHGGKLYCAGNFEIMGGVFCFGLSSWDGADWCGYATSFLTNGQEAGTFSLTFFRDTLYVSGGFFLVDGDSVHGVCKWTGGTFVDTCGHIVTGIEEPTQVTTLTIYPNPASAVVYFQFTGATAEREIIVTDQLGREIWRRETSEMKVEFPASEFSEGLYFCSVIENAVQVYSGKFVIMR